MARNTRFSVSFHRPPSLARSIEERARSYGIQRGSERANKEWNFHMGMMGWEGRKGRRAGDADALVSLRVFRVANLLHVVASSPHPARVPNLRAAKVGDGRATLMITVRLRTHPRSPPVPAKFGFDRDRPLFSFASTYSRARTPSEEVSVIGRSVEAFSPSSSSISDS